MKKISAIVLTLFLLFAFNGCGGAKTTVTTEDSSSRINTTSSADSNENDSLNIASGEASGTSSNSSSGAASNTSSQEQAQSSNNQQQGTSSINPQSSVGSQISAPSGQPTGTPTIIDDTERANALTMNKFYFTGTWNSSDEPGFHGGSASWTWQPFAYFEVKFEGVQAELYYGRYAHAGIIAVYIDDKLIEEVDLYGATTILNQLNFRSPVLSPGIHTLKVVNTSKQNEKCLAKEAGRSMSVVDRVIVYAAD